ncbi:hypothetical protein IAS59_006681 [Cryptococcus gattii]
MAESGHVPQNLQEQGAASRKDMAYATKNNEGNQQTVPSASESLNTPGLSSMFQADRGRSLIHGFLVSMSLLSHLVKFLLLGSIMASPSGHLIFTSLSAIFEGPYAPVFSAILCTQALPTLKSQIRKGKALIICCQHNIRLLQSVRIGCKWTCLSVQCHQMAHMPVLLKGSIDYLSKVKETVVWKSRTTLGIFKLLIMVKKRLSMGVDTRENGTEAYYTWFLKKRAEYESKMTKRQSELSGHDVCNQLSMLEAAVTSWAHLCLFLPKLNCEFVTLVMYCNHSKMKETMICLQCSLEHTNFKALENERCLD